MAETQATQSNKVGPVADRLLKPWLDHLGMTEYESKEQRLHDEIVAFASWVKPTGNERTARELVVSKIRELIRVKFPHSDVTLFGSVAQDLSLPNGDLDLVMYTPEVYDKKDAVDALFQIASVFKSSRLTYRTRVIPQARVPIITFETVPSLASLQADISVNQEDGLEAIPVIRGYLAKMPALRPLVLVLKVYMAIQSLNSPAFGGLGSYATICMVITFLKLNPKERPASYVDEPIASESLGYLLLDFFQYFGYEFPYETSYLSPATGQVLPKESVEWLSRSRSDGLAIECLINPGRDIGKPASKVSLIKIAFQHAYLRLQSYQFSVSSSDVLGTIIGFSEQMISYRKRLDELMKSGRLEKELRYTTLPSALNYTRGGRNFNPPSGSRSHRTNPYTRPYPQR